MDFNQILEAISTDTVPDYVTELRAWLNSIGCSNVFQKKKLSNVIKCKRRELTSEQVKYVESVLNKNEVKFEIKFNKVEGIRAGHTNTLIHLYTGSE